MSESGQSSVELVAILPVVAIVALAVGQLLAAGAARSAAAGAAQAGAMAQIQGGDPERAARAAAPGWARDRMKVVLRARSVRITLEPRNLMPGLADLLVADEAADSGPLK